VIRIRENLSVSEKKPRVTLSFAQSLDGCIAARHGELTPLSGAQSMRYTHELRAQHDAILVGVGTVISDDPRLSVRLVEGESPKPIVLDTHLRIPLSAKLIASPVKPLRVFCNNNAPQDKQTQLETLGVQVIRVSSTANGLLDWHSILTELDSRGIRLLMVEGGVRVISSLLESGLADRLIITIAPRLLGGVRAIEDVRSLPALRDVKYRQLGEDIVVEAEINSH
jgi:3,4-dihydroxy 2-butanone 4-phosphate synthase/GTP cyclohydrolase II